MDKHMKLIVNVSENFEPGMESIGDFIERVGQEFLIAAEKIKAADDGTIETLVPFFEGTYIKEEGCF
jgi:hypothetical protein